MADTPKRLFDFDRLPGEALLSARDLVALSGRSRTSVWRDVRHGRLARPVRLGPNCVRWRVEDARKYLAGSP
jgi:predicted DNA-binding transcriptional regulator AlpA